MNIKTFAASVALAAGLTSCGTMPSQTSSTLILPRIPGVSGGLYPIPGASGGFIDTTRQFSGGGAFNQLNYPARRPTYYAPSSGGGGFSSGGNCHSGGGGYSSGGGFHRVD